MEIRPPEELDKIISFAIGFECDIENQHGKFKFAEPVSLSKSRFPEPGDNKGWVVFRQKNGEGPETYSAELIDKTKCVIRTAVHSNLYRGEVIRFSWIQIHKKLMQELGLI